MGQLLNMALILATLGCGVMAGIYCAFSGFIMRALATTGPATGTEAMVAIYRVILKSSFMPLFFGSSLLCLALLIAALILRPAGHLPMAIGAAVYLAGMLGVTILRNVPLNQLLDAQGAVIWPEYLRNWTLWNHIRTASSLIAAALFCLSLLTRA